MDKAEEIRDVIMKIYFETNTGGIPHSEMIEEQISVIRNGMDKYAQQVNREVAVKFIKDMDIKAEVELLQDHQYENMFDVWQQKQEEKKCSHCGSTNIGAWGPDADKCFDCEMTWDV